MYGPSKLPIQTIVIFSKLGKPEGSCANLRVPLGISRNRRMVGFQGLFVFFREDLEVKRIIVKKGVLTFPSQEIITDLGVFLSFYIFLSHFSVTNARKSLTYVIFR